MQRTECKVTVRCSHLGNELNDLDEDVERRVFGRDHLGPFGEEAVDDALQPALRGCVALTLYPHHVYPARHRNSTEVTPLSMCYASVCWFVVLLAFCNLNPEVHAELGENAGCGTISPHLYTLSYLVFTTCLVRETIGDSGLCSCVISNTSILYEPLHTMFSLYIWFITKALKHCFTV